MNSSICISRCINDAHVPVRATYKNLYKWPESDAEFVRSISCSSKSSSSNNNIISSGGGRGHGHPRVVESISCRQLYLRSYTFSREEDKKKPEKSNSCFGRRVNKERDDDGQAGRRRRKKKKKKSSVTERKNSNNSRCLVIRKLKQASYDALVTIFTTLLSCTSTVDVADNDRS